MLLAMLFLIDRYFPAVPDTSQQQSSTLDTSAIRIHSAQRWPEKVVIDTTLPTIIPPPAGASAAAQTTTGAAVPPPREAFAQMKAPDMKAEAAKTAQHHPRVRPKRRIARAVPGTRVAAYPIVPSWQPGWSW